MPAQQQRTQRQQQAIARREQIMAVSLSLFSTNGFAATTTKQIAQQAGITEGLLYHYFPTKAELLMELVKRRHVFESGIIELLAAAEGRPVQEVMQELVTRIVPLAHENAEILRILLGEAQTNDELHHAMRDTIENTVQLLVHYLSTRVAVGEVRADVSPHASVMGFLGGLFLFFMTHYRLDASAWQEQAESYMREWLHTWLLGILVS